MTQEEYIRRLDAAQGDARLLLEAQGEYVAGLLLAMEARIQNRIASMDEKLERVAHHPVLQARAAGDADVAPK